jgi:hypothetical protein
MSLVCPHCRQPFTLAAVASSILATNVPPAAPWRCPVPGSGKLVPAGVSKKSGKPYGAFLACTDRDCAEKPPFHSTPIPAAAPGPSAAPLPQYQAGDLDDLPF